ncbi:MAG: hypothetical protein II038_12255, partial [Lachnospiraceae bacterium]|nr:hypothetical protein [Lachnospiraceae bacterium]
GVAVSLYVNDNLIGEMTPFFDTVWERYGLDEYRLIPCFYNDFCPQVGDVVKIKASANGFEDAEGETALPIDRTIEVLTSHISVILIGGEHKAQILITTLPVEAKDIIAHS